MLAEVEKNSTSETGNVLVSVKQLALQGDEGVLTCSGSGFPVYTFPLWPHSGYQCAVPQLRAGKRSPGDTQ